MPFSPPQSSPFGPGPSWGKPASEKWSRAATCTPSAAPSVPFSLCICWLMSMSCWLGGGPLYTCSTKPMTPIAKPPATTDPVKAPTKPAFASVALAACSEKKSTSDLSASRKPPEVESSCSDGPTVPSLLGGASTWELLCASAW